MQLLIDIENDSVVDKIIQILKVFQNDGVKIIQKSDLDDKEFMKKNRERLNKIKKDYKDDSEDPVDNWMNDLMTNENPNINDDEILADAYWEYYSEKHRS